MALKESLSSLNPFDTLSNLFKTGYSIYQDQRDFNYQKNLQKQLFERDDTSMLRKMKDYQSAGINPLMALGSAGSSVTSAGVLNSGDISVDSNFFSNQQQKKLERDTLNQELKKRDIEMQQMKINLRAGKIANWSAMQDLNTKRLEQDILKAQLEAMNSASFYPMSSTGRLLLDSNQIIMPLLNNILNGFSETVKNNPTLNKLLNTYESIKGEPAFIESINDKKDEVVNNLQNYIDNSVLGKTVGYYYSNNPSVRKRREYEARVLRGARDSTVRNAGANHKTGKFKMRGNIRNSRE